MKKTPNKKWLVLAFGILTGSQLLAQPTGTPVVSTEWHRGGNVASSPDNIFGWGPVSTTKYGTKPMVLTAWSCMGVIQP